MRFKIVLQNIGKQRILPIDNQYFVSAWIYRVIANADKDFARFLHLYDKYISAVAETYAWALMKNHFHFLARIKNERDIPEVVYLPNPDGARSPVRDQG